MQRLAWFAAFVLLTAGLPATAQEGVFTRAQLIEDTRQLADILEKVHPDPYLNGGGKIAFHRRLHRTLNSIPDEGMTSADFFALLAPFVGALQDAHTRLHFPAAGGDPQRGLPFGFAVIDSCLYVRTVVGEQHARLLGARLLAVEGVPFREILDRASRIIGTQNPFNLLDNVRFPLWNASQIPLLVPEWDGGENIEVQMRLPSGEVERIVLPCVREEGASTYASDTVFEGPSTARCDFAWKFLDEGKQTAILAVRNMSNYREALELRDRLGLSREANERRARRQWQRYHGTEPPQTYEEIRAGIPSATEVFLDLLREMKAAGSKLLLVDLRSNSGGSSAMGAILTYFLFGTEAVLDGDEVFLETRKYSPYYFATHDKVTLKTLNEGRRVPVTADDYVFSARDPWVHDLDRQEIRRSLLEDFEETVAGMPTFAEVYEAGDYEAFFRPEKIVVVCNVGTFSSAFTMMHDLYRCGAILVGSPSGQAANVFGSLMNFELDHSGLSGYVSQMRFESTVLDEESARALMPHHVMTYDRLAAYDFDRNAEILWALDLYAYPPE